MAKKNVPAPAPKAEEPIEFTPAPELAAAVEAAEPAASAEPAAPKPNIPHGMSAFEWAMLSGHKGRDVTKDVEPAMPALKGVAGEKKE